MCVCVWASAHTTSDYQHNCIEFALNSGPNSTIIPTQCNVRFNDTLVLSCPTHSNWVKVSRNASSVCESSVCTVNSDRDLTYDDSGLYFCKNTTYSQYEVQNFYVNVTVLGKSIILYY